MIIGCDDRRSGSAGEDPGARIFERAPAFLVSADQLGWLGRRGVEARCGRPSIDASIAPRSAASAFAAVRSRSRLGDVVAGLRVAASRADAGDDEDEEVPR